MTSFQLIRMNTKMSTRKELLDRVSAHSTVVKSECSRSCGIAVTNDTCDNILMHNSDAEQSISIRNLNSTEQINQHMDEPVNDFGIVNFFASPIITKTTLKPIAYPRVDSCLAMILNDFSRVEKSPSERHQPIVARKDISVLLRRFTTVEQTPVHEECDVVSDIDENCENDSITDSNGESLHCLDERAKRIGEELNCLDDSRNNKRRKGSFWPDVSTVPVSNDFSIRVLPSRKESAICTFNTDEFEESLVEELSLFTAPESTDIEMNAIVPLLTPPCSPLTVMLDDEVVTVCEWPSNLIVDSALQAVNELRPLSPASLELLELDEQDRVGSFFSSQLLNSMPPKLVSFTIRD